METLARTEVDAEQLLGRHAVLQCVCLLGYVVVDALYVMIRHQTLCSDSPPQDLLSSFIIPSSPFKGQLLYVDQVELYYVLLQRVYILAACDRER